MTTWQWITFESFPFFRSNMIINYPFIKNEIHIIIGGDHGAGSFKMSLQVANVENPNRKDNTVVFVSISSLLLNALKLK